MLRLFNARAKNSTAPSFFSSTQSDTGQTKPVRPRIIGPLATKAALIGTVAIAGCSINPTPFGYSLSIPLEDYTAVIVRQVRCEVRDAFIARMAGLIGSYEDFPGASTIAEEIMINPAEIQDVQLYDMDPRALVQATFFQNSSVSYEFDLTMTESNNHSATASISPTMGDHPFTLGINEQKLNLKRINKRTFNISQTRIGALQQFDCTTNQYGKTEKSKSPKHIDWIYPMRGKINLAKTVNFFVAHALVDTTIPMREDWSEEAVTDAALELSGGWMNSIEKVLEFTKITRQCNKDEKPNCKIANTCHSEIIQRAGTYYNRKIYEDTIPSKKDIPPLTDKLQFTTEVTGGLHPSIKFSTVNASFKLQSLGLSVTPSRTDAHIVSVVMTPKVKAPKSTVVEEVTIGKEAGYELKVALPPQPKVIELTSNSCVTLAPMAVTGQLPDVSPEAAGFVRTSTKTRKPPPKVVGAYVELPMAEGEEQRIEQMHNQARETQRVIELNRNLERLE